MRKITSEETKFYHALAALPPEIITRIPEEQISARAYSSLKEAVISAHERTKPELFEKLISTTKLTGRPSVFLQEILQTASKVGVQEELVRYKFVQSIPPSIVPIIAAQKELSLSQLGKLADELLPLMDAQCHNVPSHPQSPSNISTNM